MQDVAKASGIMNVGKVGRSISGLIRARTFKQCLATILADDPCCFIRRPPDRNSENLAVDTMLKGAAML